MTEVCRARLSSAASSWASAMSTSAPAELTPSSLERFRPAIAQDKPAGANRLQYSTVCRPVNPEAPYRTRSYLRLFMRWCPGEDSNLHELLHWYLKPARLPVPPPGQDGSASREEQKCTHWGGACQST